MKLRVAITLTILAFYGCSMTDSARTGVDFGQNVNKAHFSPFGMPLVSSTARFGFTQKEADAKLSSVDFSARHLSSSLGRFYQIDPMPQASPFVGQTPYGYVQNNPLARTDPEGNFPCWVALLAGGAGAGICIVAVSALVFLAGVLTREAIKTLPPPAILDDPELNSPNSDGKPGPVIPLPIWNSSTET